MDIILKMNSYLQALPIISLVLIKKLVRGEEKEKLDISKGQTGRYEKEDSYM